MKIRLADTETEGLLYDLCVKLGFCLPVPLQKRIVNNPPMTVEKFAEAVYRGEGLDPLLNSALYQQVYEMVAKAFERHQEDNQSV
ncbi:hypothetical protein [Hymenobacter ruricola]|uniref:Uncharacterized protein n=1 Tax=Hymenobacter ruricola TaxID=2791023 RepID=A0ABS0I5T7_9BACT|nr:hypothetical protein [Hymenobacter ruricola]MBF9222301.1 hypothetical protein [Hymenobacter ruricola]